jgi:hypothetical protein
MVTMSCAHIREAISARFDAEEQHIRAAELEGHLALCHGCGAFARSLRSLARPFGLQSSRPVPPAFLERILVLAHDQRHLTTARPLPGALGWGWRAARRHVMRTGPSAAAMVIAVSAAVALATGAGEHAQHLVPHLVTNGCISSLLRHHVRPGY